MVDMTSQLTEKMKSMKKNQEASELACANLEKTVAAMQEQMHKQADDAAALDALNKELQNQVCGSTCMKSGTASARRWAGTTHCLGGSRDV